MENTGRLTRKKSLRHDQPLWLSAPRISLIAGKKVSARDYDVVIVGAGISGALMAQTLAGKGLSILVIDRRRPARGSTVASTAMIQHEIDVPLHQLSTMIGNAKAIRVWRRSARAVEQLANLVRDLNIHCSFERRKTLFLAGKEYGSRALKAEVAARNSAGIDAALLDAATLLGRYGIDRTAAIESAISACANPAQLACAVLRNAKRHGVEIVADIEVTDVREAEELVFVATSAGSMISARHVVFCTGYEFLESVAQKDQTIISTWALASRPDLKRPEWLDRYLVWEGSDPYIYFRSTPDGRVIVGGEDEDFEDAYNDESKTAAKARTLVQKFGDLTGFSIGKPDFTWSAAFGATPTGLPMIGAAPGMQKVFVTMGYGGNGITFSQIAADLISGEIFGHRDTDWDLFPIS